MRRLVTGEGYVVVQLLEKPPLPTICGLAYSLYTFENVSGGFGHTHVNPAELISYYNKSTN